MNAESLKQSGLRSAYTTFPKRRDCFIINHHSHTQKRHGATFACGISHCKKHLPLKENISVEIQFPVTGS